MGGLYLNFDVRGTKKLYDQDCLFCDEKSGVHFAQRWKRKREKEILQERRDVSQKHAKIDLAKSWGNWSEMFREVAVLRFLGKHEW